MSNNLGSSVGVWNENQIASLETGFSNFARGGRSTRDYTSGKPFYKDNVHFRSVFTQLGISSSEYRKRKELVNKYAEQGLTIPQINNFYEKFKLRGGGKIEQFDSFIADQRLIADAQEREEAELLARLKEEEKKEAISDSNLFPPDEVISSEEKDVSNNVQLPTPPKKNNLLIYGVIGVVALVGIIILIKRK